MPAKYPAFLLIIIPIICLAIFNIGLGLILSALYVFFRDMRYLWGVFTTLLMYASAIFYTVDALPELVKRLIYANPIYVYIKLFRDIVLSTGSLPSIELIALAVGYALIALGLGALIYRKNNHKFLYYV